ncbi:MAG: hypothetical protein J6331_02440, partial [Lentisphaeria bacterium]|nr:hypothetical protein [Lentisphaeria bacterium]
WAFCSFNELYRRKNEVFSSSDTENVYVCASSGTEEEGSAVMIVNNSQKEQSLELDLGGKSILSCRLTDESFDFAPVVFRNALPPFSVMLLLVR